MPVSTTAILSFDMDDVVRQRIADTKHIWEPRGTQLHNLLEQFLQGNEVPDAGDYSEYAGPMLDHVLWTKYQAIATEFRMVDKRARWAGSCDFVLKGKDRNGKDRVLLGDLKTRSSDRSTTLNAKAQLGCYAATLSPWFPSLWIDACITVNAFPGRT